MKFIIGVLLITGICAGFYFAFPKKVEKVENPCKCRVHACDENGVCTLNPCICEEGCKCK